MAFSIDPLHTNRWIYKTSMRNSETEKITISYWSDNWKIMPCQMYYHKSIIICKSFIICYSMNFENFSSFVIKNSTRHCCLWQFLRLMQPIWNSIFLVSLILRSFIGWLQITAFCLWISHAILFFCFVFELSHTGRSAWS